MIRIVEIGEIAWQGMTEPVLCRGEDGFDYFVKGNRAGVKALISEWVANRIGHLLKLPIPDFAFMRLDSAIATFSVDLVKINHLGKGTLFGSRRIPNTIELSPSVLPLIDENLRARVLAFDWWVANSDRVFVDGAGNPNLLWAIDDKKLIVIDHNLAFEPSLLTGFWYEHAFRNDRKLWTSQFCSRLAAEFRTTITHLGKIWSELPEDWIETPSGISLSQIESLLWRFETNADTFWRIT